MLACYISKPVHPWKALTCTVVPGTGQLQRSPVDCASGELEARRAISDNSDDKRETGIHSLVDIHSAKTAKERERPGI
jgi:hypothetical protein